MELRAVAETGIDAGEIDPAWCASLKPAVGFLLVGHEAVLLDPATGASHLLDPAASLIVQCLDAQSTLRTVATDIAAAVGAPQSQVQDDVLRLARELGAQGLLQGVRREAPAWGQLAEGLSAGVPVGSDLGDWTGWPDGEAAISTVLVNWGTGCGFCTELAAEVQMLAPVLAARSVEVLLVTDGSSAELTEQLDAAIRAETGERVALSSPTAAHVAELPAFLRELGTPAAYLVDARHRTTTPAIVGMDGVRALLRAAVMVDESNSAAAP